MLEHIRGVLSRVATRLEKMGLADGITGEILLVGAGCNIMGSPGKRFGKPHG